MSSNSVCVKSNEVWLHTEFAQIKLVWTLSDTDWFFFTFEANRRMDVNTATEDSS